ncbi:MAG: hypothetical protein M3380_05905, partial [Chloroflexota bacterium]|nr:hypothetical protein [Chloroflexota bacterium]
MKQLSRQIAGSGADLQRVLALAERLERGGLGNEYTDVCYAFENGARALPADDQKKLALELVRLRREVYQYGKVCAQILYATSWPLEELERFFDASAKPAYRPGEPSFRDVGRSFWQYCAQAFFLQLERLSDHERFPLLLHRFVVDVWSIVFAADVPSVPRVLRLLRLYPDTARVLFEALEAREQERLQFIARFDLARVERSLRQDLSCQIWDMLHREYFRVADDEGAYHRALQA